MMKIGYTDKNNDYYVVLIKYLDLYNVSLFGLLSKASLSNLLEVTSAIHFRMLRKIVQFNCYALKALEIIIIS